MKENWRIKSFKKLSVTELYDIINLRNEVFVIEQDAIYQDADFKDLEAIHVFCYDEKNKILIAYCRILPKEISYKEISIGRVVVRKKNRGSHVAKELIEKSLEVIENRFKTREIRISAQFHLQNFYNKFGFKPTGEMYLEDGIDHIEMFRK